MTNKLKITFFFLLFTQLSFSQYQIGLIPRVSPDKAIYQKIGNTEIEIRYGSPAVNDREIFGGLISYDNVWRAGANNATTVEISDDIVIDKMELDSGKYALFIIPSESDKWTVIFNKTHKQWGAFKYDEKEDALRTEVVPLVSQLHTENLTYSIEQTGFQFGSIILNWDSIQIEIPFETNYTEKFKDEVDKRAEAQPDYLRWIVYIQGAEHLEDIGSDFEKALQWINDAEKIMNSTTEWNDQFYPREYVIGHLFWTKAKLFAKTNDYKKAVEYAQKMKYLDSNSFYTKKNDSEKIDELIELWSGK